MPVSDPLLDPRYAELTSELRDARTPTPETLEARLQELLARTPVPAPRVRRRLVRMPPRRLVLGVAGGCAVLALGVAGRADAVADDLVGQRLLGAPAARWPPRRAASTGGRARARPPPPSPPPPRPDAVTETAKRRAERVRSATDVPAAGDADAAPAPDREADDRPEVVQRRLRRDGRGDPRHRHLRRPHRHRPVRDAGGHRGPVGDRREGADRAHAGGDRPVHGAGPPGRRAGRHQRPAGARRLAGAAGRGRAAADRDVRRPAGGARPDEAAEGDPGRAPRPRPPAPGRPERRRLGRRSRKRPSPT